MARDEDRCGSCNPAKPMSVKPTRCGVNAAISFVLVGLGLPAWAANIAPARTSRPMKTVCFVNTRKFWGGGEKWHLETATQFRQRGYDVVMLVRPDGKLRERVDDAGLEHHGVRTTNFSFLNPAKTRNIFGWLKGRQVDTMIVNTSPDLKAMGPAAKLAGVDRIIYKRGLASPIRDNALNRLLLGKMVTAVIADSKAVVDAILARNPRLVPRERIHVIYNGIDVEAMGIPHETRPTRSVHGATEIVLGNVARFERVKHQRFLIELARLLKDRDVPFELRLAGTGSMEREMRELAASLHLDEQVKFYSFVDNVSEFMDGIDVLALPSSEGFGYVAVEAMACRRPVIAMDAGAAPEIVEHNKTGFLAAKHDLADFAEKVMFFAAHRDQIARFGHEARKSVLTRFTLEQAVGNLEKMLLSLP